MPYGPHADRRRDRRLGVTGYAILRSRAWTGTEVFGGLVDVSAGGARIRVKPGTRLLPGEVWAVDIEVATPALGGSAPVRLFGSCAVLRIADTARQGTEVGLRFEAPLAVVEGTGARRPAVVPAAS
jgi:hypothetical protein